MDLDGFERFRLVGDEMCGVGLQCMDDACWDGGRPQAYYVGIATFYDDDPEVAVVETVADLLAAGRAHLDAHHGHPTEAASG